MSESKCNEPTQVNYELAEAATKPLKDFLNEMSGKAKTEHSKARILKMQLRLNEFEAALNQGMNPIKASELILALSGKLIDLDITIKKESSKWQILQRGLLGK